MPGFDNAVVRFFYICVDCHRTDAVSRDKAGNRILDVLYMSADVRIDVVRILKRPVASRVERAVFECYAVKIAQRLFSGNMATH